MLAVETAVICPECDRLRIDFDRIVRCNIDLLHRYQAAVLARDEDKVVGLRSALPEVETLRHEALLKLTTHRESHGEMSMAAGQ
jgi:hypothetical protein